MREMNREIGSWEGGSAREIRKIRKIMKIGI